MDVSVNVGVSEGVEETVGVNVIGGVVVMEGVRVVVGIDVFVGVLGMNMCTARLTKIFNNIPMLTGANPNNIHRQPFARCSRRNSE